MPFLIQRLPVLSLLVTGLFLAACASAPTPGPVPRPGGELSDGILATFDVGGETFRVWVTNREGREQLLAAAGPEGTAGIPMGPILEGSGPGDHNAPWRWHFDPEGFRLVDAGEPSCDGRPSYVDENSSLFISEIGLYCPKDARLLDITTYP